MGQEDRLKREIDLLAKLLAKLLTGMKNNSSPEQSLQEAKQTLHDALQWDLEKLKEASFLQFEKIVQEKNLEESSLKQLAGIFYQLGEKPTEQEDGNKYYEKSLVLYEQLSEKSTTFSLDTHFRIEKIKKHLGSLD